MWVFLALLVCQPAYLLYKVIKLSSVGRDSDEQEGADDSDKIAFYWIAGNLILKRI